MCSFQLIGVILLSIGVWVLRMKGEYQSIHDVVTIPTILAIAVGAVMVATAILGLVAAAASKLWPLRIVCHHIGLHRLIIIINNNDNNNMHFVLQLAAVQS